MRLIYTCLTGLATATLLVGCGGGDTSTSSPSTTSTQGTTTTQCREIEQVLKKSYRKYASSKDDYEMTRTAYKGSRGGKGSGGSGGSHNEGKNCLSCHNFASAGTVFNSLNAANNTPGASGYKIKLSTGTVYSTGRGTGNSLTYSFPNSKFTAQVMDPNGNIVNSSANLSHDGSRRACNTCHTVSGNNGAPGRITSKRVSAVTPVTISITTNCTTPTGNGTVAVSFNSNILPILTAKCKSCHGSNGRFTVTSANATYANISALKGSASAGGQYLLDKSSNTIGHGGGEVISKGSAEYISIKAWVDASAPNN